ncbi:PE family domain protein [Mycobacterium kansasii]|uniref:PE family domain protein n=1 Tax=Mycobacterium kansasii TaxID=1768 RepID=A0A1V3WC18_MYCKA|nr:PE family domain protein [Mycobacterium kansasii]
MTGSGTPIPSLAYMQAVVPYISGTPSQLIPLNTPKACIRSPRSRTCRSPSQ